MNNKKALIISIVLIGAITIAQVVGAQFSRSLSLDMDALSMALDVVTYCVNLYAECSSQSDARKKLRNQLIATALSLAVLSGIGILFIVQAIQTIVPGESSNDGGNSTEPTFQPLLGDDDDGVDGTIVLVFSIAGLVIDLIVLGSMLCCRKKKQPQVVEAVTTARRLSHADASPAAYGIGAGDSSHETSSSIALASQAPPEVAPYEPMDDGDEFNQNMCSAVLHTGADLLRSISTLTLSIVIFEWPDIDSNIADAWTSLIVCIIVVFTSWGAFVKLFREVRIYWQSDPARQRLIGESVPRY